MKKVQMKVYSDVYKELQQFKLDHDCRSMGDAIKLALFYVRQIGAEDSIDLTKDVPVTCRIHGLFMVNAQAHLDGLGCPDCNDTK